LAQEKNEEKNQIEIKGFHFTPQTLTVKSGAKVTWINRDDDAHVVTSSDKKFEKSPPLDTDQKFAITAGAPRHVQLFLFRASEDDGQDYRRETLTRDLAVAGHRAYATLHDFVITC